MNNITKKNLRRKKNKEGKDLEPAYRHKTCARTGSDQVKTEGYYLPVVLVVAAVVEPRRYVAALYKANEYPALMTYSNKTISGIKLGNSNKIVSKQ